LCEYYAECVRLEARGQIRAKTREENRQFVYLPSITADNSAWHQHSIQKPWIPFIHQLKLKNHAFVGFPTHRFHWQDTKTDAEEFYCSPIFVVQVEYEVQDGCLMLRQRGAIRANDKWLERRFKDAEQRRHFLELCGLHGVADKPQEHSPSDLSFSELVKQLQRFYPGDCQEQLNVDRIAVGPPLQSASSDGIYNRAVLVAPGKMKFTERLYRELLTLAHETPDKELDASVLGAFFPSKTPQQDHVSQATTDTSFISFTPLNEEQRAACKSAQANRLTVICGPPGTGKSQAATTILTQSSVTGNSALFASRNHQPLQAVVPRLNAITEPDQIILRLNHPAGSTIDASLATAIDAALSRGGTDMHRDFREEDRQDLIHAAERALELNTRYQQTYELRHLQKRALEQYDLALSKIDESLRHKIDGKARLPEVTELDRLLTLLSVEFRWSFRSIFKWIRFHFLKRPLFETVKGVVDRYCDYYSPEKHTPPGTVSADRITFLKQALRYWIPVATAHAAATECKVYRRRLEEYPPLQQIATDCEKTKLIIQEKTCQVLRSIARDGASAISQEERTSLTEWRAALRNKGPVDNKEDQARLVRYQEKCTELMRTHVPLVATTNLSVGRDFPLTSELFDLLVIDEASQCDIASAIPLLFRCRRAVIVGDPKQLSHIVQFSGAMDRQLRQQFKVSNDHLERFSYRTTSLYDLADSSEYLNDDARVMLRQHYRCNPAIANFCNKQFYNEDLLVLTSQQEQGIRWTNVVGPVEGAPGGGSISHSEIEAVLLELDTLQQNNFSGSVGIVTPFRKQADRIRDKLHETLSQQQRDEWNILVDTADGFQGDERDIILFSLVGNIEMPRGSLNFLKDTPNRFNVAVSRARKLLHIFGDQHWAASCGAVHIEQLVQAVNAAQTATERLQNAPFREDLVGPEWEPRLAEALRREGIEFEQQYPTCGFFLDFSIFKNNIKLNVEVDGEAYHRGADGHRKFGDGQRDAVLIAEGWKVCRFWVYELREDMARCLEEIQAHLKSST
jgi:very-short-patch-repair endonuclease